MITETYPLTIHSEEEAASSTSGFLCDFTEKVNLGCTQSLQDVDLGKAMSCALDSTSMVPDLGKQDAL